MEPCRSDFRVLWVDWVEYTRTRARAGSGISRRGFVALSLPLDEPDVDGFAAAVEEFLSAN